MTPGTRSEDPVRGRPVELRYDPDMGRIWPWPTLLLEQVASWMAALPGDPWLDAGCGGGKLGEILGERKKLIGLDIDGKRLVYARTQTHLTLLCGSLTSLPLADGSMGGIACVETLEHISDMAAVLAEFSRCLRPRGYLLLSMPSVTLRSLWQMSRRGIPVYCSEDEHVRELSSVAIGGFRNRFETWPGLESQVAAHGFEVVKQGGIGYLFPMWTGRLAWLEHVMNIFYRERVNRLLGKLPGIRLFPYYRIYLFRRKPASGITRG